MCSFWKKIRAWLNSPQILKKGLTGKSLSMMVLESGVLPPPLRLYAAAAAASGNAGNGHCFRPNPILPPHHLFPHFAARFPINLAAGFAAGLPPFLSHQNPSLRFGVAANQILNSRNLEQNMNCGSASRSDVSAQRKRQRHYTATPTSDDSASESHSPTKGELPMIFWIHILLWWVNVLYSTLTVNDSPGLS